VVVQEIPEIPVSHKRFKQEIHQMIVLDGPLVGKQHQEKLSKPQQKK
jgi:hypothetical protein